MTPTSVPVQTQLSGFQVGNRGQEKGAMHQTQFAPHEKMHITNPQLFATTVNFGNR